MSIHPILAVIPCRGGSKGLPGKNVRPLAGLPLVAHSIRLAALCPEIDTCIVSTDSEEIAAVSCTYGANVPFLRRAELAQDDTPMWAVLQHALTDSEQRLRMRFASLLLLQPTNPCRLPEDITHAVEILEADSTAVGVVAVSKPPFNPRWVCVEESDGYMKQLVPDVQSYVRRQDVPEVYRINGLLYLWRRDHVLESSVPNYYGSPHRMLIVPDIRGGDVDTAQEMAMIELLLRGGLVEFPWIRSEDK